METTQHTPADVRERVAKEVYLWEATRFGAAESWALRSWEQESNTRRRLYFNVADRILALIRTPRGEGEAREEPVYITCMGCGQEFDPDDDTQSRYHEAACEVVDYEPARVEIARRLRDAALRSDAQGEAEPMAWRVEYRRRGDGDRWYHLSTYTNEMDARERAKHAEGAMRVLECRIIPLYASPAAALRSEADALDLLRWAEARGAVLEPVAGNVMPPGTYACYVEGVGDDPAEYEDAGEPYMGPGILGAIRAALRSDAQGEDRWEDVVFGPITEAYNEAHAARRSEGGGE